MASISQYGITWFYSGNYTTGQYANGDYYIVAPSGLTITGIYPPSTSISGRVINGSMLNPTPGAYINNGFDSSLGTYLSSLNVARPSGNDLSISNPLKILTNSSIISVISYNTAYNRPQFSDAAILTVVSSSPASGSFRPPYVGSDKTHYWNKNSLKYSILKSLSSVTYSPSSLNAVASVFQRPWLEIETSNEGREWHAYNNQPIYGADMAGAVGEGILSLHHNFTSGEKEPSYINLVQYGIDVYGAAKNGGDWHANGGFCTARKPALIFAGLALSDTGILWYGNKSNFFLPKGFQEDQQVFYISTEDVGKTVRDQWVSQQRLRLTYLSGMIGLPEWGITHVDNGGWQDGSNWSTIYRDVNAYPIIVEALAIGLTSGGYSAWNNTVFFEYADRLFHVNGTSNTFGSNMWSTYRSQSEAPAWSVQSPIPVPAVIPEGGNSICLGFTCSITTGTAGNAGISITASSGTVYVTGSPTDSFYSYSPTSAEKVWGLSRIIGTGELVTVSYVQPGNGLKDVYNTNYVQSFSNIPVINYSLQNINFSGGAFTKAKKRIGNRLKLMGWA